MQQAWTPGRECEEVKFCFLKIALQNMQINFRVNLFSEKHDNASRNYRHEFLNMYCFSISCCVWAREQWVKHNTSPPLSRGEIASPKKNFEL